MARLAAEPIIDRAGRDAIIASRRLLNFIGDLLCRHLAFVDEIAEFFEIGIPIAETIAPISIQEHKIVWPLLPRCYGHLPLQEVISYL